jgi:hypothetical protein
MQMPSELLAVGLRDDEGRIVRGDGHAVGEGEAVGHLASGAVGGDQRDQAGGELAGGEVEADVVDVGVAATVDDDVVPGVLAQRAKVAVGHQRPVGLTAQEPPPGRRDGQQPAIGQVADAHQGLDARDHVAPALQIDGKDLLRPPVRDPQPAVVPPRRLGEGQIGLQDLQPGRTLDVHRRAPWGES